MLSQETAINTADARRSIGMTKGISVLDGLHQFTELPNPDSQSLAVFTKGKPIKVKSLVVYEMKSM